MTVTKPVGRAHGHNAILCERCGYVLDGLPPEGECPECGRPIGLSQPVRRQGSAWQERPGLISWLVTAVLVLRRPNATFAGVRIDGRSARGLFWANALSAAVLMATSAALPWLSTQSGYRWLLPPPRGEALLGVLPMYAGASLGLVILLTWVETVGVRHFGRRRGWRVTGDVAWTVAAHASIGWVIGAGLMVAGVGAVLLHEWVVLLPPEVWLGRRLTIVRSSPVPYLPAMMAGGGFFSGMLVFEVLVYLGIRRCRYANPPPPRVAGGAVGVA